MSMEKYHANKKGISEEIIMAIIFGVIVFAVLLYFFVSKIGLIGD